MPSCIMKSCNNQTIKDKKDSGITYHRFPRPGHETRDAWIHFVRENRREDEWLPSDYSVICSDHFKNDDKYKTKTGRVYIKKSAIPNDPYKSIWELQNQTREPVSDSESIIVSPEIAPRRIPIQKKRVKKTCLSYTRMVHDMKKKLGLDAQAENDLTSKAEFVDLHKSLIKRPKQNRHAILYSTPLKKFAMSLHFYSPAAYKYIRRSYNKALPHINVVTRWHSSVDAEPGFTEEAFKALENKYQSSEKPVLCSLLFDEMIIKIKKLSHNDHKLGAVNFGAGPVKGEVEGTIATKALVFMLVSINENWKLPVGYFLLTSIGAEQKVTLIKICLKKCHKVGVTVANLTFDCSATNLKTAEILGCQLTDLDNIKTYFPHPSTSEKVCIFLDPCHVMKLIRNTFERKGLMFDKNGGPIKWQLLINLNKLQETESLRFNDDNLESRHMFFRNLIMKMKLCTQLLSRSIGKALVLCNLLLTSSKFNDYQPTFKFIILMNNFFDIINPRKSHFYGFRRPIDNKNKAYIFSFLDEVKSNIFQLKFQFKSQGIIKRKNRGPIPVTNIIKMRIINSSNKLGFVAALICIQSIKTLYNYLVEEKKLIDYLSMHRLNQDHLGLFFGLIKNHGNNNPTVLEFRAAYKNSLNHLELRSSFSGNSIPLDNFSIVSTESVNIINSTSNLNRHDEEGYEVLPSKRTLQSVLIAEKSCEFLVNMLNENALHEHSQLIVGYLSSFVAHSLANNLKCEECVDSLKTTYKLPHHKLITVKDMGDLTYSSEDVFKICLAAEKIIRRSIKESGGTPLSSKYNPTYIIVKTLKLFSEEQVLPFSSFHSYSFSQHAFNQPATLNHKIHLIRAIISNYTTIRLHHEGKNPNNDTHKLKKMVLKVFK